MLNNSHYYHMAKSGDLAKRGVSFGSVELDLPALMAAKDTAVREAILQLFASSRILSAKTKVCVF